MSFNFIKSCYMLKFIFINNNLLTESAVSLRVMHCALVFIFTYENIIFYLSLHAVSPSLK